MAQDNSSSSSVAQRRQKEGHPCYSVEMLDEGKGHMLGGVGEDQMGFARFHHIAQNGEQFETCELFISRTSH